MQKPTPRTRHPRVQWFGLGYTNMESARQWMDTLNSIRSSTEWTAITVYPVTPSLHVTTVGGATYSATCGGPWAQIETYRR